MKLTESSAANVGLSVVRCIASSTTLFRHFMVYAATSISAVISGAIGLIKNGTGTLTLTENNTYTGNATINAGTLRLEGVPPTTGRTYSIGSGAIMDNNIGYNLATSSNTFIGNGTLIFRSYMGRFAIESGTSTFAMGTTGLIDIKSGATLESYISSSGEIYDFTNNLATLNLDGSIIGDSPFTLICGALTGAGSVAGIGIQLITGGNNLSTTFTGTIASSTSLVKRGIGMLTLTGVNTYNGETSINSGTLEIGSTGLLGNGSYNGTIVNNGTFQFGSNSNQNLGGNISGTGTLIKNGTSQLTLSGVCNYTGQTQINAGSIAITNASTLNGVISGAGSLTKSGSFAVTIGGNNTYSGGTFFSLGTITFSSGNAFGTGLFMAQTATQIITGNNVTLPNNFQINAGATMQFRTAGANTITVTGNITQSGNLNKTGNGYLDLTAATLTYTGSTTITGGFIRARKTVGASTATATLQSSGLSLVVSFDVAPPSGITTFRFFQGSTTQTYAAVTFAGLPVGSTAIYTSATSTLTVTVP